MIPLGAPARRLQLYQLDAVAGMVTTTGSGLAVVNKVPQSTALGAVVASVAVAKNGGALIQTPGIGITPTKAVVITASNAALRQVLSTAWTPNRIAASSWFDASDSSTIIEGVGGVSTWEDRTPAIRHVTQPTSTYRPTWYNPGSVYSREVRFLPVSYLLYSVKAWAQNCPGFTLAALVSAPASTTTYVYLIQKPTGGVRFAVDMYAVSGQSRISVRATRLDTDAVVTFTATYATFITQSPFIFVAQVQYTPAALIAMSINGNLTYQASGLSIGNCANTTPNTIRIGDGIQSPGNTDRNVKELFVFARSITTAERQQSEGYLAHRWGYTSLLPTTHPYKYSPPT